MVGDRVRDLGIPSTRLDAAGRGVLLLRAVRQRIHELAWDGKILRRRPNAYECEHCVDVFMAEYRKEIEESGKRDLTDFVES